MANTSKKVGLKIRAKTNGKTKTASPANISKRIVKADEADCFLNIIPVKRPC